MTYSATSDTCSRQRWHGHSPELTPGAPAFASFSDQGTRARRAGDRRGHPCPSRLEKVATARPQPRAPRVASKCCHCEGHQGHPQGVSFWAGHQSPRPRRLLLPSPGGAAHPSLGAPAGTECAHACALCCQREVACSWLHAGLCESEVARHLQGELLASAWHLALLLLLLPPYPVRPCHPRRHRGRY